MSAERKLLWPLDAQIALTSSFCEYRPLRYHAGIDFSTGGRVGVPIVAVDNGHVWRVRTSPYGYGKVLYLRLDDGRTAVYAHLSGFNEAVERLVLRDQLERQAYTVDLFLRPGEVRARRGEVIGWTGSTGIGTPHLHFEVRDAQNRPVNPFTNGYALVDSIPPTMVSLALIPLDGDARVDGVLEPHVVPLANYDGVWTSKRVPVAWGRVGIALMAWDRTPPGRYRLSVHATTLSVDGNAVFLRRYDRLSLVNQNLSAFDRNFALLALGEGRYYNLFLPPGNALEFYGDLPVGSGILVCGDGQTEGTEVFLREGRHELAFTVADFAGAHAEGRLRFSVGRTAQFSEFVLSDSSDAVWLQVGAHGSANPVRLAASARNGENWLSLAETQRDSSSRSGSTRLKVRLPDGRSPVHVVVEDTLGSRTAKVVRPSDLRLPPKIRLSQTWGRDWVRLELKSSRPLRKLPSLRIGWPEEVVVRLEPTEISPGLYETHVVPESTWPRDFKVRVYSGAGRPTVVSHWIGNREAVGTVELVPDRDSLSVLYHGVVTFSEAFPESGLVRIGADELDTTLTVKGKLLGPVGGEYGRPDLGAEIAFGRGVIAEPMFVRVSTDQLKPFRELEPIGPAYRFEPQEYPLAGEATISIRVPDTVDFRGIALYGISPRKAECLAVPEESFDHTLRTRVPSLYTVGVYRDTIPPTVRITSPRVDMVVRVRRPLLVASVRDDGAGFAKTDDAMEMRLDGDWVPAEYDPERDTLTYQPPSALATGRHTVVVHARDQVGNERSASLEFTVE